MEVVVCDAGDGRLLPCLRVFATLIDATGREVGTYEQPFLWHPTMYHYGRNGAVPGDGTYHLRVRVEPPAWLRYVVCWLTETRLCAYSWPTMISVLCS